MMMMDDVMRYEYEVMNYDLWLYERWWLVRVSFEVGVAKKDSWHNVPTELPEVKA